MERGSIDIVLVLTMSLVLPLVYVATLNALLVTHNTFQRSVVEFKDQNGVLLEDWLGQEQFILGKKRKVFPPLIDYGRGGYFRAYAVEILEVYLFEEVNYEVAQ